MIQNIPFNDLSYTDKRKILRQYYIKNKDANRAVKILAFAVREKLTNPIHKELLDCETIISFLIDGYLAFEVLHMINELVELDPIKIEAKFDFSTFKLYWENEDGDRVESDNMIYISNYIYETSFLSSIYNGLTDPNDDKFILSHVDFIIDRFSRKDVNLDKILNMDSVLKRGLKINRILKKNEK